MSFSSPKVLIFDGHSQAKNSTIIAGLENEGLQMEIICDFAEAMRVIPQIWTKVCWLVMGDCVGQFRTPHLKTLQVYLERLYGGKLWQKVANRLFEMNNNKAVFLRILMGYLMTQSPLHNSLLILLNSSNTTHNNDSQAAISVSPNIQTFSVPGGKKDDIKTLKAFLDALKV